MENTTDVVCRLVMPFEQMLMVMESACNFVSGKNT